VGLGEQALIAASRAEGAVRDQDYVWLGYKSGFQVVILGIGENLRAVFPVDGYGTPLDSIPMLQGVNSYRQISLVVNLTASSGAEYWIQFAQGRYRAPMILGATAVMATDYYQYLSSKQILGLIGGMKGAAEYERLIDVFGNGRRGMDAQSMVHVIVVLLVIVGNGALFASRGWKGGGSVGGIGR
jgi:hypothetical protein